MINVRLRNHLDEIRRDFNAEVYVVLELGPRECGVLVVPRGSEREMTINPIGSGVPSRPAPQSAVDWLQITKPTFVLVNEAALPMARPTLRLAEESAS